jgi:hypothetical protein
MNTSLNIKIHCISYCLPPTALARIPRTSQPRKQGIRRSVDPQKWGPEFPSHTAPGNHRHLRPPETTLWGLRPSIPFHSVQTLSFPPPPSSNPAYRRMSLMVDLDSVRGHPIQSRLPPETRDTNESCLMAASSWSSWALMRSRVTGRGGCGSELAGRISGVRWNG